MANSLLCIIVVRKYQDYIISSEGDLLLYVHGKSDQETW